LCNKLIPYFRTQIIEALFLTPGKKLSILLLNCKVGLFKITNLVAQKIFLGPATNIAHEINISVVSWFTV
jgi:hypothetical protein